MFNFESLAKHNNSYEKLCQVEALTSSLLIKSSVFQSELSHKLQVESDESLC